MEIPPQNPGSSASFTPAQLTSAIKTQLAASDSSAASMAQNLQLVQHARLSQLTRTASALQAKFGATDSRTVAAQAAVTAQSATVSRMAISSAQAATPAPSVTAGGWALHGRFYDAQLKPVEALTVFLVDSQQAFQAGYGFAYTDSTGYFVLNYVPPAGQQNSAAAPLYVAAANQKGQPVYLGKSVFKPAVGAAIYQNITLTAGEKPIGDPPPSIRKIAIPRPPRKD
jgi:hypothetical protein